MDSHDYLNDSFNSPALSASHLDNHFDYDLVAPSPNLPATPSYNGSYQNSPYTTYSDLEFDGNIALEQPDYDPADYDASNNPPSLLNFMNPHVSVTPPVMDSNFERPFDHSSPASSNGLPDQESESRSRASSVSSHSHSHYPSSPPIHGFESLRFESPHWNTSLLPGDKPGSPSQKPPSPPSIIIPANAENPRMRAPLINAPQGDGGVMNGPQLHFVPATPVSGGVPDIPFINNPTESPAPPTWNTDAAPQNISLDTHISSDFDNSQSNELNHYYPHQQRSRSKSDTSTRPPSWSATDPPSSSFDLNDIVPSASPQPQPRISFTTDLYQSGYSDPSSQSLLLGQFPPAKPLAPQYLSPEMALSATTLRRARSDSGRVSGHRLSRSESGISYPPSAHSDFMARAAADSLNTVKQQFLHPTETVNAFRGHHRRSSSGSRDRGIGGMGLHSAPGSSRASPYPSPNASPLLDYDPLPSIPNLQTLPDSSRGRPVSMPAYGAPSYGGIGELSQQLNTGGNLSDIGSTLNGKPVKHAAAVSKQNVTTTATAEASERRRKTDANFACPVPGCGSTFTRHFNLKGHMRSHNEEKPFQCKWPGCGKGFARAHDCKRHEQLHFNYRPHKCEGCGKSFQRMDALNRHLRSEGGQDCLKAQDEAQANGTANSMTSGPPDSAGSFVPMDLNIIGGDFHEVKAEPDHWRRGELM